MVRPLAQVTALGVFIKQLQLAPGVMGQLVALVTVGDQGGVDFSDRSATALIASGSCSKVCTTTREVKK